MFKVELSLSSLVLKTGVNPGYFILHGLSINDATALKGGDQEFVTLVLKPVY